LEFQKAPVCHTNADTHGAMNNEIDAVVQTARIVDAPLQAPIAA